MLAERLLALEDTRLRALNGSPAEDAGEIERECAALQIDEINNALEALGVAPGALGGLGRLNSWLGDLDYGALPPPIFTPARQSNRPPLRKTRLTARGAVAGHVFAVEKRLRAAGAPAGGASRTAAKVVLSTLGPHLLRQCVEDGKVTWQMLLNWRLKYAGPNADPFAKIGFEAVIETLEDEDFDGSGGVAFL